jgi:hypothetical protein
MNAMNERAAMNCEEFELVGLDAQRDGSLDPDCRQRATQHARVCAKCASLKGSWKIAQEELAALGDSTRELMAPARVETRLLQQFRLKHHSRQERHAMRLAAWALAAAALLVCTVSVWDWHRWRQGPPAQSPAGNHTPIAQSANAAVIQNSEGDAGLDSGDFLLASNDSGDFTALPGSSPQDTEGAAIVRVGMQRGSLTAFGLPVNEERAGDWIQVDLMVASDGSPQAVRLPQ